MRRLDSSQPSEAVERMEDQLLKAIEDGDVQTVESFRSVEKGSIELARLIVSLVALIVSVLLYPWPGHLLPVFRKDNTKLLK